MGSYAVAVGSPGSGTRAETVRDGALEPRVVLMTAPDLDVARRLARALVEGHSAACVNLVPAVRSIYRWQGAIEEAGEVLMIAKTTAGRVADLMKCLGELHPYDVPECVVLEPRDVEPKYRAWLLAETH